MLTENHKLAMTVGALEGVRLLCCLSPVADAVRVHNVECNGKSTDLTLDPRIVNGLILAALEAAEAEMKRLGAEMRALDIERAKRIDPFISMFDEMRAAPPSRKNRRAVHAPR